MVVLSVALTGLMASVVTAGTLGERQELFTCGTLPRTTEERHAFKRALTKRQEEKPDDGSEITLETNAVICCGQGGQCPPEEAVKQQFAETNKHYEPAKITFKLNKVERKQDPSCGGINLADTSTFTSLLKTHFQQGDKSHLNVLYVNGQQGSGIQGVAMRPTERTGIPGVDTVRLADGAVVNIDSLPRTSAGQQLQNGNIFTRSLFRLRKALSRRQEGFNGGHPKVTSHEFGHVLGLDHPFVKGNAGGDGPGKSPCGDGDEIPDTPAQETPTQGCPSEQGFGGRRPQLQQQNGPFRVTRRQFFGGQFPDKSSNCSHGNNEKNMMDYATCTDSVKFTPGQIKHLREMAQFRIGQLSEFPKTPGEKGEKSNGGGNTGPGPQQNGPGVPGGRQPQENPIFPGGPQDNSLVPGGPQTQDNPIFPGGPQTQDNPFFPGGPQTQDNSIFPGGPQDNSLVPGGPQVQGKSVLPEGQQPHDGSITGEEIQSGQDQDLSVSDADISRVVQLLTKEGFNVVSPEKRDAKNVPDLDDDVEKRSVDMQPRAVKDDEEFFKNFILDRRSIGLAPRASDRDKEPLANFMVDRRSPRASDSDKEPLANFMVDRRSPRASDSDKEPLANFMVDRRSPRASDSDKEPLANFMVDRRSPRASDSDKEPLANFMVDRRDTASA